MTTAKINSLLQDYTPKELEALHQDAAATAHELAAMHNSPVRDYAEGENKKACYMIAMWKVV